MDAATFGNDPVIIMHENNSMNTELHSPSDRFAMMLVTDTLFDTNGVSRFIRDLSARAESFGVDLTVVSASPLAPETLPGGVVNLAPLLSVRMPFYKEQRLTLLPPLWRLYRELRRRKPRIVHLSTPGPLGWSALLLCRLLRIPCAATYHTDFPAFIAENTGSPRLEALTRWVMRRFYRSMRFLFSRSRTYLPVLRQFVDASRALYLPPGTDTDAFSPDHRVETGFWERYGLQGEGLVILYVGRLNVEKNLMFAVERFRELRRNVKRPVRFVLVGEGDYVRHADRWREEGICHIGVRRGEELGAIYASADLFLSASLTETLGQTVMEAQASGLPAVVGNRGGVTETVVDQHTGFILDAGQPERWVAALVRLVRDDELRRRMGEAARKRMEHASISRSCEAFFQRHREATA